LEEDAAVRVVAMRGEGDAFVAGADVSQFAERRTGAGDVSDYGRLAGLGMAALLNLEKPLLASLRGPCIGGGVVVALTADLRFAADDAFFRIPAARLGLGYEAGGIQALADAVGWSDALDLLFTARRIDAHEACRLRLVNEVSPAADLDALVRERADRIAENAPLTLHALKLAARELRKPARSRDMDAVGAAYAACFSSEDYREGVRAFLEKRKPRFRGC
jgi:enoyl-CoA hydratase/carnithine racemase